jgi:CubicO group peptidase (beta-lactamase class C family)
MAKARGTLAAGVLAAAMALSAAAWAAQPATPSEALPPADKMLFWTPEQQAVGFKNFVRLYASQRVAHGGNDRALPADPPITIRFTFKGTPGDTASFMRDDRVFGLLVLKDGRIKLEEYAGGFGPTDLWTSFSAVKSMTSTLVAAALKDGKIRSLDQPITDYAPALKGSGYDGVTIQQALNMSTGVRWDEDYLDPKSDTNAIVRILAERRSSDLMAHIAQSPRAWPPGSKFDYNSGATHVLGQVVAAATGKRLADYLSEKIWVPAGMEADAAWTSDGPQGQPFAGCCLNARLRDFGRFGLYALDNFTGPDGVSRAPEGWLATARKGSPAFKGYGDQWWLLSDHAFAAIGVFGQVVYIDPGRHLVIVTLSAYPTPLSQEDSQRAQAYFDAVAAALDGG